MNQIKLKTLKKTKSFYMWELKRSDSLTESERSKYLMALKSINKIIKEKEKSGEIEIERDKHFSKLRGY